MLLCRVIGTIWCTRKIETLEGMKFQICEHLDLEFNPLGSFDVAVDAVQAGVGEIVLIAKGSAARQSKLTWAKPIDAVIMAVVENLEAHTEEELVAAFEERKRAIDSRLGE
jgi:microcompartment protein CcmK/EutM